MLCLAKGKEEGMVEMWGFCYHNPSGRTRISILSWWTVLHGVLCCFFELACWWLQSRILPGEKLDTSSKMQTIPVEDVVTGWVFSWCSAAQYERLSPAAYSGGDVGVDSYALFSTLEHKQHQTKIQQTEWRMPISATILLQCGNTA